MRRISVAFLPVWVAVLARITPVLGNYQSPLQIVTTSCRTSFTGPKSTMSQVMNRDNDTTPSGLATQCATGTRPAQVSLIAATGVYVNVFDEWGACDQVLTFQFNPAWTQHSFGAMYYTETDKGCAAKPTATLTVRVPTLGIGRCVC